MCVLLSGRGGVWRVLGPFFAGFFVPGGGFFFGDATLFWLASLLVLCSMPQLRRHPLLYTLIIVLEALGEEFLQALSRWQTPNFGDGRDLSVDALGFVLAYLLVWIWWWLRDARPERKK